MSDEQLAIVRKVSFCIALPEGAIAALAAIAGRMQRPAGTLLQIEGEPATIMYLVGSGQVKIARIGMNGREQVLNIIGPGGHFNTIPMFDGGVCPANAEALTDVVLLMLPRAALLAVVESQPALALALLKEFTGRLRHMVDLVDRLALHTVHGRLAGLLLEQAGAAEHGVAQPALTQAEMAARLGTVREMVGRTLKTFEVLGLLRLERGVITIIDREGLAAQAEA
ncbi:MAG: Crp/Fnr family transcriptional regulator [Kouleothrix sp.]|nr:Crp/Fnr family transcriptional regulator [Kouleothrix sp.]